MSLKLAGVGAEPKKLAFLGVLVLVAGYVFISNGSDDAAAPPAARVPTAITPAPVGVPAAPRVAARGPRRSGSRAGNNNPQEFRPSLKSKDMDPSRIDPTLHLPMLAKLKDVAVEGGKRSLFEISAPPPPETKIKEPEKIQVARPFVGPRAPAPEVPQPKAEPPPEPKAPPIPLKFYGFVNGAKTAAVKRAFFLDGDEIVIAGEGELVKKRYKIVRIGVNSALVEDTQFKSNNQQNLPLEAELQG
jgi:hypothetical protein